MVNHMVNHGKIRRWEWDMGEPVFFLLPLNWFLEKSWWSWRGCSTVLHFQAKPGNIRGPQIRLGMFGFGFLLLHVSTLFLNVCCLTVFHSPRIVFPSSPNDDSSKILEELTTRYIYGTPKHLLSSNIFGAGRTAYSVNSIVKSTEKPGRLWNWPSGCWSPPDFVGERW